MKVMNGLTGSSVEVVVPAKLRLRFSLRNGDLIQDAYRMVGPGDRGYNDALAAWLWDHDLEADRSA